MASEYTSHYNLDLYADSDKPNLRDQYNGAMNKIDQQLYKQSVDTTTANSNANNAVSAANAASKAAADEATRAKAAESSIKATADAANAAAADEATRAKAAEGAIKTTADSALSKANANAAQIAQNTANIAKNTDSIGKILPITADKIADGAITESKISADLLKRLNSGISPTDNLKVLYIGDSYSVPTTYNSNTPIPVAIQNITNWNVTNDSKGNRGYIAKGNGGDNRNFKDTINSYSENYDLIIIAGGRNDSGYTGGSSSAEYTAALDCFNTAHSKFPNAKIIAVPMMWHDTGLDSGASNAYVGIVSAAKYAIDTYCIEGAQSWGLAFTNWQEGGIHPDTEIAASYAHRIVNAICTNLDGWVSYNDHINSGSDYDLYFAYSHGIYTVNGFINGVYNLKTPDIPHWFHPMVSDNNFVASVLTTGAYCAVFINHGSISVFGTPAVEALVSWSSSPFGSA